MKRYRTTLTLAVLVLVASGVTWWDQDRATSEDLRARRENLFPEFRRERVEVLEITHTSGRYELRRSGTSWRVVRGGQGLAAEVVEVERALSELEGATPLRRLGALDGASRRRFGLDHPRATVVVREASRVVGRFELGGGVDGEEAVYVAWEGAGYVLPRSLGELFDRPSVEYRDRSVVELDVARVERLEITAGGSRRVLERRGLTWRMTTPELGRASRGAVEAITAELRDLDATRVLADEVPSGDLGRFGLLEPVVTLVVHRGGAEPVRLRFGGDCPGHEGEATALREGTPTVVCVGKNLVDALRVGPEGYRDDGLLASRTDEIGQLRVRSGSGPDLVLRRDGERWTAENAPFGVDPEALESWMNALHDLRAGQRLPGDQRASHGLEPAGFTLEFSRTGVEGTERLRVGAVDAQGLYVSRDDEVTVLQFAPSVADTLRVEAVRFRPRRLVRDAEEDLRGVALDGAALRETVTRAGEAWSVTSPVQAPGDSGLLRDLARMLATLDAERWVTESPRPEFGLAAPRLRVTARFEGAGAREVIDGGVSDAAVPRVRSYTVAFGAQAPGGGVYATLEGTTGVFVLPRSALDALGAPHIDRGALRVAREDVLGFSLVRRGMAPLVLRRVDGRWRTGADALADETRVNALLDRLSGALAPQVFGYGPAPVEVPEVVFVADLAGGDAGARAVTLTVGACFGQGEGAGCHARRGGLDAALSLPRDVVDALREFTP
ncbi:MAG: DUF4340 domain-containing protein [Deltaproteobacteria bacterium]|nr:DUF4340 domain-containing protein [Deltaproteobacteria bacterium]